MDLQAAQMLNGRRWSPIKLAALVCFLMACGLLIGSLMMAAKAGASQSRPLAWVQSSSLP